MSALIAFRNRKLSDLFNRKLVRIAREGSKYDVDLVSTNGQVVQAHRLILSMYSKYLRRLLSNSSPDLKIIVPLNDVSYAVLEKVVNLFYYGEIRVLTSLKAKVYKALTFLEVDVPFEAPRPKPIKADFLVVDGQINSDPNHVKDANGKSLSPNQTSDLKGQQPQPPQQKQQPVKDISHSVSTEATTHSSNEIKEKNGNDNTHAKSVPVTDASVGSNGVPSHEPKVMDSTVNDTSTTSSNGQTNNFEISPSLLYDDDIGGDMDQLGRTVNDLIMDIGITEMNAIDTVNPNQVETGQAQ